VLAKLTKKFEIAD